MEKRLPTDVERNQERGTEGVGKEELRCREDARLLARAEHLDPVLTAGEERATGVDGRLRLPSGAGRVQPEGHVVETHRLFAKARRLSRDERLEALPAGAVPADDEPGPEMGQIVADLVEDPRDRGLAHDRLRPAIAQDGPVFGR